MENYIEKAEAMIKKIEVEAKEQRKNKPPAEKCKGCGCLNEPFLVENYGWKVAYQCDDCVEASSLENKKKQAEETLSRLVQKSGLFGLLEGMTFESYPDRNTLYNFSIKYAESFSPETTEGILFYGRPGSGKTHLSCAIANHIIREKQIFVLFAKSADILYKIKDSFKKESISELDIIHRYCNAPLLIIDDFGTEKLTEWAEQVYYKIIDDRLISQSPLIISSNFTPEELENRLGERIVSRIISTCTLVKTPDRNYRIENKQKMVN